MRKWEKVIIRKIFLFFSRGRGKFLWSTVKEDFLNRLGENKNLTFFLFFSIVTPQKSFPIFLFASSFHFSFINFSSPENDQQWKCVEVKVINFYGKIVTATLAMKWIVSAGDDERAYGRVKEHQKQLSLLNEAHFAAKYTHESLSCQQIDFFCTFWELFSSATLREYCWGIQSKIIGHRTGERAQWNENNNNHYESNLCVTKAQNIHRIKAMTSAWYSSPKKI